MDNARSPNPVEIDRSGEVLTFTLNNVAAGNEVSAPMFDAMIAALRSEATAPAARVLAHPRTRHSLLHWPRARGHRCNFHSS